MQTCVRTDSEGRYKLTGLNIGVTYKIRASARNYAGKELEMQIEQGMNRRIADLVLESTRPGPIAGIVVDQAGNPIKDVEISVRPLSPADIMNRMGDLDQIAFARSPTRTMADGHFRFSDMPGGEYRVMATVWNKNAGPGQKAPAVRPAPLVRREIRARPGKQDLKIELQLPNK